ncbi:MAG: recombination regulator RecX [Gammaproteobacteria bacterium]|nr:recombination regulator RecX [Gammaproteobacteria bacterium]
MPDVREKAVALLARREHSRRELHTKLKRRGFPIELIDQALDWLAENDLQCDERYAEAYTHSRRSRGFGPLRILSDLRDRGVASSLIDSVVQASDIAWADEAVSTRARKFGDVLPEGIEERARQSRFLARRGFSAEHVRTALRRDIRGG